MMIWIWTRYEFSFGILVNGVNVFFLLINVLEALFDITNFEDASI